MKLFEPIACKCALYKCISCSHTTEIYTTEEWLGDCFPFGAFEDINSPKHEMFIHSCEGCGSLSNATFATALAFRSDDPTNYNKPFEEVLLVLETMELKSLHRFF
jgi:hypothetical protein